MPKPARKPHPLDIPQPLRVTPATAAARRQWWLDHPPGPSTGGMFFGGESEELPEAVRHLRFKYAPSALRDPEARDVILRREAGLYTPEELCDPSVVLLRERRAERHAENGAEHERRPRAARFSKRAGLAPIKALAKELGVRRSFIKRAWRKAGHARPAAGWYFSDGEALTVRRLVEEKLHADESADGRVQEGGGRSGDVESAAGRSRPGRGQGGSEREAGDDRPVRRAAGKRDARVSGSAPRARKKRVRRNTKQGRTSR